ncbi:hypothetical protein JCM11491_007088 [Sporobolomyces phaffii]
MAATIPSRIYLISKWGDVALGLSTGVFAYYLYEKKSHRTPDDSLVGLVRWKLDQRARLASTATATATTPATGGNDWDELTRELSKEDK